MELVARWPVLGRHEMAAVWLRIWVDLGRASRTIDAYGRRLAEYLEMCERVGVDPLTASRADVALYVRELTRRPGRLGVNVVSIESGSGLANATVQQRLVPVRLFYDFLMEEGLRRSNPVGRGRYTPGRAFSGGSRGLVPRLTKLPWIPTDEQWLSILDVVRAEPPRTRVMLALAYDCGLRREELCSLRTGDLDPGRRTVRVRAETTKNRLERVVPYSAVTGVLLSGYLAHRAMVSRLPGILAQALLVNRSPRLQDLTTEAFTRLHAHPASTGRHPATLYALQRAVADLGHCQPPVRPGFNHAPGLPGVPAAWAGILQRWYDTSPLTPDVRAGVRVNMAKTGRWLAAEHPEQADPRRWTPRHLRGMGRRGGPHDHRRLGRPPRPSARADRHAHQTAHQGPYPDGQSHVLPRPAGMGVDPAPVRPGPSPGRAPHRRRAHRHRPPASSPMTCGPSCCGPGSTCKPPIFPAPPPAATTPSSSPVPSP